MTLRHQIELESIFLISIVAVVSLFFVVQRNSQFNVPAVSVNSPLVTEAPEQSVFSQISPDGTKKVIMKVIGNKDNSRTYSFSTSDGSGDNERFVFSKTLDMTNTMTIPYNTWSSNNQYFFVGENAKEEKKVFVFNASGESFGQGEQYLDVTDSFKKQNTGNNFAEATGWASESLIIVNTTKQNNTKGPSYWFELPSRAVTQLATEF